MEDGVQNPEKMEREDRIAEWRTKQGEVEPENLLWFLAGLLAFWSFGFAEISNGDLWYHLASGSWTVDHLQVPVTDPFSFTALGERWIHDCWMADVLLWSWTRFFGLESLVWWKWGMIAATHLLVFRVATELNGGNRPAAFLATLFGVAVGSPFLGMRPQLFTFLGFAVLLWLLVPKRKPVWAVVALFLLWANLHAGFIFGLLAMPILLFPHWIEGDAGERRRIVSTMIASCAVCVLNPNGVIAVSRPLRYAFDADSPFREIAEWRPAFDPGGMQSLLYPASIVIFVCYSLFILIRRSSNDRKQNRVVWAVLGIGVLTLAMSLRSRRFIPLFAMSQTLVLGIGLSFSVPQPRRRWGVRALTGSALMLGLILLLWQPVGTRSFRTLIVEDSFPIAALDAMDEMGSQGNVLSYYQWGGYVLYRAGDRCRVYIDGRAGGVYDAEIFRSYVRIATLEPGWLETLQESNTDLVLWPRREPGVPRALIATGTWEELYADHLSVLLARTTPDRPRTAPTIGAGPAR